MSFGMLSEASDVVICYELLLRIKAKGLRQKILILCDYLCQQQPPRCATLFFLQFRNTNRYSFVPHCKYFSMLCGLKSTWPRTTSAAMASPSERAPAFCALHCYRSDTPVTQQHLLRERVQVFRTSPPSLNSAQAVYAHAKQRQIADNWSYRPTDAGHLRSSNVMQPSNG